MKPPQEGRWMAALDHMVVTWSAAYETHIDSIDRQHQVLVGLISRLQSAMRDGTTRKELPYLLDELVGYTRYHFAWEEQLMDEHGCPGLEQHRAEHAALTEQVLEFQRKFQANKLTVGAPVMAFLRHWLTDHILETDQQYAPFLLEKGVQ
jgi:hemerythrin